VWWWRCEARTSARASPAQDSRKCEETTLLGSRENKQERRGQTGDPVDYIAGMRTARAAVAGACRAIQLAIQGHQPMIAAGGVLRSIRSERAKGRVEGRVDAGCHGLTLRRAVCAASSRLVCPGIHVGPATYYLDIPLHQKRKSIFCVSPASRGAKPRRYCRKRRFRDVG